MAEWPELNKKEIIMKKSIVLLLILSLLFSMTACDSGDGDSGKDQGAKASEDTEAASDSSTGKVDIADEEMSFPLKEKATLKFLTQSSPLAPEDPNGKLIWQRFEEETNIHIDWTNYTWDVFQEKRNLKVASGDLPDAIFDAGLSDYDILSYAEDGIIIPVEDLIDTHMPNLKAIYDKYPEYRQFVTALMDISIPSLGSRSWERVRKASTPLTVCHGSIKNGWITLGLRCQLQLKS